MTKNFTKIIILCLIVGTSLSACKKSSDKKPSDDSNNTESFKVTINGKAVAYNNCIIGDETVGGITQFGILGAGDKDGENFGINIMANLATVKAGQTFKAATESYEPNSMVINYNIDQNNSFYTIPAVPQGSVTLTEVTSTIVKGTFTTAKLYDFFDNTGSDLKYTVSNGSFVAARVNH